MADRPDAVAALSEISDDDLDSIVDTELKAIAERDDSEELPPASTEHPAPDAPPPADEPAHEGTEPPEPESATDGEPQTIDPAGTKAIPPAASVAAPDATPATISPEGATPFQFKASGRTRALQGALELRDGSVLIPKASQERFRTILASEHELRTVQIPKLRAERTAKDIEADAIIAQYDGLLTKTDEELYEWIEKFKSEAPDLRIKIKESQLEAREKALLEATNPAPDPEERAEARTRWLVTELNTTFQEIEEIPEVKAAGITRAELRHIYDRYVANPERLVRKGEKDGDPPSFDPADVLDAVDLLVALKKSQPKGPTADQRNDRRNADIAPAKPNVIPPVVRSHVDTSQRPKGKGKESYKGDRAGLKRDFMAGDLDFDGPDE